MKRILLLFSLLFSLLFYGQQDAISVKKKGIIATINGINGDNVIRMRKEQLKNAVIAYRFEDKKLLPKSKVISFQIKYQGWERRRL